jgi:hypothetical protein
MYASQSASAITIDDSDDENIIEPGFIRDEDLERIIDGGVLPFPLKIEEEELD